MSNDKKQIALDLGKFAEQKAWEYYVAHGYAIRERNWRHKKIEIDLVAQKDTTIVFIEVKARSGKDSDPVEAVNMDKMKRMTRGADFYLKTMDGDYEYRYDIFALTGNFLDYTYEVIEDAFLSPLF